ncbi:MAG: DUF3611 family protein [Cyanobacteria bacterium J06642_2]
MVGESSGFILASKERMRSRARRIGQFSFWIQLVLVVLSLIFWPIALIAQSGFGSVPAGSVLALWITLAAIGILGATTFLTFQYWRTGSLDQLKRILYANIFGAFLALIGSATQIGELLFSFFIRRTLVGQAEEWSLLIATLDTNITLAHLISLTSVLWIYGILDRAVKTPK